MVGHHQLGWVEVLQQGVLKHTNTHLTVVSHIRDYFSPQ